MDSVSNWSAILQKGQNHIDLENRKHILVKITSLTQ